MSIIDWVEWYNKKDVISDFCLFCIFSQPWNIGHSERRKRAQTENKGSSRGKTKKCKFDQFIIHDA